jgi:hypothetical protein
LALPASNVDRFDNDGRESIMEIVHSRCAGMDVSKRDAKVCVRVAGRGRRKTVQTVRTWGSTTNAILALREHLINEQVSLVVMEATGTIGSRSCATRRWNRVEVRGLTAGQSQLAVKLGQPDVGTHATVGAALTTYGTGRHCQTARVRQAVMRRRTRGTAV